MLGTCKAIGDIDAATGTAFGALLRQTIENSDEPLASADCAGLTRVDPAGYHALVDAARYAARRDRTLVIRNMSSPCAKLIGLYGWDRDLCVESSRQPTKNVRGEVSFAADPVMDRPRRWRAGTVS